MTEIFTKIEEDFEALKNNPSIGSAKIFLEETFKKIEKVIPASDSLSKNIKFLAQVIDTLSILPIPKSLSLPTINNHVYTPEGTTAQSPTAKAGGYGQFGSYYGGDRSNQNVQCNADNCKGCCIKYQCFPSEECSILIFSRTIMGLIAALFFCCCCSGIAIGAICYFVKKRKLLIESNSTTISGVNTTNSNIPVQGIPVSRPQVVQGQGVVRGFHELQEESVREVQMSNIA